MENTKKAPFIAIEGTDGSGKKTQAEMLAAALVAHGVDSVGIDFPRYNDNHAGKLLRECLAGKRGDFVHLDSRIASMLYTVDRFESSDFIRKTLREGKAVIADRFSGSNQIHQGGKYDNEDERIEFLTWLDHLEHAENGTFKNPRPDLVVYLKVPVEVSLELLAKKRAAKNIDLGEEEMDQVEKDRAYLENSHRMALWLADREPNWRVINCVDSSGAIRSREDIHADVLAAVLPLIS